jgi:2-oxoglutarate ferredoxin oxidoreductase subunit gamma
VVQEIRFSGSGGQGVILIGIVLAEAAGIHEGKDVAQTQSYGGEVRGGAVMSDVVISEEGEEIEYPAVINADVLLAMSQEAADRYIGSVKQDGLVLLDSAYVLKEPISTARIYNVPLTIIAQEKTGTKLAANIVALGVICELSKIVSKEALEEALLERVPKGTEEINRKALRVGFEIGRELKKGYKLTQEESR